MGGNGESQSGDLRAHEWQIAADYRYFHADDFFFGSRQATPPAQYFGQPLIIDVHSVNLNVTYALTDRFNLRLTVPLSHGSQSRFYADTVRHVVSAGGLGDVGLVGTYWLFDSHKHHVGNAAVGVGVKTATGRNGIKRNFYFADGSTVLHPIDQSVELGDGGWGIILQGQAFRRVGTRAFAYFTGSYLLTPRNQTNVLRMPPSTIRYSVSDVYTGRLGVSYSIAPERGISASLGGRIDGIPYHDLLGANDGFRRPGYVVFVDPGISFQRGRSVWMFSAPMRVAARLATQQLATSSGGRIGAGDLAKVVVFFGYARRF